MRREELETYLDEFLDVARFRDGAPNGLQVEGRADVQRITTGVTASAAFLDSAMTAGTDAVIVHHGYFWRGEDARLVGMRRRRIGLLIESNVNLFAFHLPLDAHPEIGNNAALARHLELEMRGRFGEQDIGFYGDTATATLGEFVAHVEQRLERRPLVIGDSARSVRRIAWCTGAAQGLIEDAAALGVDVFLTGEASEQTVHIARECGIAFISAGHHATERYGVQALGEHLARKFGLEHRFIDAPNPV